MKKIKNLNLLVAIILMLALVPSCKKESLKSDASEIETIQDAEEPDDDSDESAARNGQAMTKFPTMATSINSPQNGYVWDSPTGSIQVGANAATVALSINGVCNDNLQCFRSAELQVTGFGFNIPADATITNIKVKVYCKASNSNSIKDLSVLLSNWDNVVGTPVNRAKNTFWGTNYTLRTYGGPANSFLANGTIDYHFINAPGFGVRISCKNLNASSVAMASIDYVKITIRYTVGTNRQSQSRDVTLTD